MVAVDPVILTGLGLAGTDRSPTILERTDQEFLSAVLETMASTTGPAALASSLAGTRDAAGILRLLQPVQRTFNVVLFSAACDTFGRPRLDPRRIESSGLILRRLSGASVGARYQSWGLQGRAVRGWLATQNEDQDPDPERRPAELTAGHPEIDRRLAIQRALGLPATERDPFGESVSPLFVAPPDVCEQAGQTILYGVIPVTSTEVSEAAGTATAGLYDSSDVRSRLSAHLHRFLKLGGPYSLPRAGQLLAPSHADDADLADFALLLRQLTIELDAFGTTPAAADLLAALNGITLTFTSDLSLVQSAGAFLQFATGRPDLFTAGVLFTRPAGDFLRDAARVLIEREVLPADRPPLRMPGAWPVITASQAENILGATVSALTVRHETVKPREGRFDDQTRRYAVRGFVRVRRPDDCPPDLVWSDYSETFTIAPWFESGNVPPVQVALPDLLDRDKLRRLKPNVAFAVPESLQAILTQNDPQAFLDGEGSEGSSSLSLDWICSFSIPIITICAFIVLNIFLQLFDIIFRWLLFIKICIPIPRRG